MSTEQTLQIVKILLRHYGEHPKQNDALIAGALVLLDGAPIDEAEHEPEKQKPKQGAPKKSEPKSGASKREPFDVGKLRSLYDGGWSAAMIAEDMGVSEVTVYKYAKKEGLQFGKK